MHDYKKIVKEMRKKSFPEIKGKIFIIKFKLPIGSMGMLCLIPCMKFIFIHPKNDKKPVNQIRGILAHELSHFSRFGKKSWIKSFVNAFRYWITSKKWRTKEEKETDKLTIRKGYGKELFSARFELEKNSKENSKYKKFLKYYLSSKEIKKDMDKIKK